MKCVPIKFFVVGTPITHSLSPLMHTAAFRAVDVPASFEALDPKGVDGFLSWCADVAHCSNDGVGVGGFCVTVPYKQEAFKRCEILSVAARTIGAVNTVTRQESGELKGDNTDCIGFIRALEHELKSCKRPALSTSSKAFIWGTGGVARAIVYSLIDAGIQSVTVSSRHLESAQAFIASFYERAQEKNVALCAYQSMGDKSDQAYDVVINATPLGLCDDDALPARVEWIKSTHAFVFDAVYRKDQKTRLVNEAHAAGIPACDGRRMLIEQGIAAQDIWNNAFHFWDNEDERVRAQCAMYNSVLEHEKGE